MEISVRIGNREWSVSARVTAWHVLTVEPATQLSPAVEAATPSQALVNAIRTDPAGYTQVCSKCRRELPASREYFYRGSNRNRFASQCITCMKATAQASYEARRLAVKA